MYLPCLVLPYQRLPSVWYTPLSVLTHTIPFWGGGLADAVEVVAALVDAGFVVPLVVVAAGGGVLAAEAGADAAGLLESPVTFFAAFLVGGVKTFV